MSVVTAKEFMSAKANKDNTKSATLIQQPRKQKERTKVEYPEEGRRAVAQLMEEEIGKMQRWYFRKGDELLREADKYASSDRKKYNTLRSQGKELIEQSLTFTPAAFQRHMETFVFPDGNKYPISYNQFYLLLRASEQGYSMTILLRLAFHLTKDEERTVSYSYEELVAIASCNASRQYFDYKSNQLITPELDNSETLNGIH